MAEALQDAVVRVRVETRDFERKVTERERAVEKKKRETRERAERRRPGAAGRAGRTVAASAIAATGVGGIGGTVKAAFGLAGIAGLIVTLERFGPTLGQLARIAARGKGSLVEGLADEVAAALGLTREVIDAFARVAPGIRAVGQGLDLAAVSAATGRPATGALAEVDRFRRVGVFETTLEQRKRTASDILRAEALATMSPEDAKALGLVVANTFAALGTDVFDVLIGRTVDRVIERLRGLVPGLG